MSWLGQLKKAMPGRDKRRVAAKTASTAAEASAPTWRNRIACVATYNVLEHDDKMDQFEDVDVPFEAAGELKMTHFRFWPGLDPPPAQSTRLHAAFQELSRPAAIRRADLDRHRLGTVRLNVGEDYFVAYSRGRLPFDRQSDRAIKVGWSYKLA